MKTSKNFFYATMWRILWIALKFFAPMRVQGARHSIDKTGPFIIATNHTSYIDPVLVSMLFTKHEVCFLARASLFRNFLFSLLIRNLNAFPVKRGSFNLSHVKKKGVPIVVFPEGARTSDGHLLKGEASFGLLAIRNALPILPIYIDGAFEMWPRNRKCPRRGKITFVVGEMISLSKDIDPNLSLVERSKLLTDRVMTDLANLKKKGVFSNAFEEKN